MAPEDLTFSAPRARYAAQVPIAPNTPSVSGTVREFHVAPPLPPGLQLDPASGVITGTPLLPDEVAVYRVFAEGDAGSTHTDLEIGITGSTRFAYVSHPADDTLSIHSFDPYTGSLRVHGLQQIDAEDGGVQELIVRPGGDFAFAPKLGRAGPPRISVYAIDRATGRLTLASSAATGVGPHVMRFHPGGATAYVTAQGEDRVHAYAFDPVQRVLQELGSIATEAGPSEVAVDPLGRFVYVVNSLASSVSIFRIQPDGSLIATLPARVFPGGAPKRIAIEPRGERAYVTLEGTGSVMPLSIDPSSGALEGSGGFDSAATPTDIEVHPTGRFAMVTSQSAGILSVLSIGTAGALELVDARPAGARPIDVVLDPAGAHAYVLDEQGNQVLVFGVDPASGELTEGRSIRTRVAPTALGIVEAASPSRRRVRNVYSVALDSRDVSAFAFDEPSGALTPTGAPAPTGTSPQDIAFEPRGRLGFVSNLASRTITILDVAPDSGALTVRSTRSFADRPRGLTVDPSGRYLFVVFEDTGEVHSLAIDASAGTLTTIDTRPVGSEPRFVSIDPTGRFVYVSNVGSDDLVGLAITASGTFTGEPFSAPAPGDPQEVRFSPAGDLAYVPLKAARAVVPYAIDASTGALTILPERTHTTSLRCGAVTLHPLLPLAYVAVPGKAPQVGHIDHVSIAAATGRLELVAEIPAGINPWDLAIAPRGDYLFVANRGGSDVDAFRLDAETGVPVHTDREQAGTTPQAIAITTVIE